MPDNDSDTAGFSRTRLDALVDGVLAIVLTLLVFDLHAPVGASNRDLLHQIAAMRPQFISFVISFGVVAVFWYGHRMESHWLIRSDRIDIGLTLVLLLGLSFVPFSASLLGKNIDQWAAVSIYGGNLMILATLRFVHYCYSTAGHRLVRQELTDEAIREVRLRLALTPIGYLIAAAIAPVSKVAALIIYALMPINYVIPVRQIRGLTSLPMQTPDSLEDHA